eukprot:2698530-Prymnesium_polylepis.1
MHDRDVGRTDDPAPAATWPPIAGVMPCECAFTAVSISSSDFRPLPPTSSRYVERERAHANAGSQIGGCYYFMEIRVDFA